MPPATLLSPPRDPNSTYQPSPFSPSTPKPHSSLSQIFLISFSPASLLQSISPQTNPLTNRQISHQPHPLSFPYIPESFSQCLFVIHPLRSQILISSIFL